MLAKYPDSKSTSSGRAVPRSSACLSVGCCTVCVFQGEAIQSFTTKSSSDSFRTLPILFSRNFDRPSERKNNHIKIAMIAQNFQVVQSIELAVASYKQVDSFQVTPQLDWLCVLCVVTPSILDESAGTMQEVGQHRGCFFFTLLYCFPFLLPCFSYFLSQARFTFSHPSRSRTRVSTTDSLSTVGHGARKSSLV